MDEKDLGTTLAAVAVRRGTRGFTFDDLIRAAARRRRVTIGSVADWLAGARSSGLVVDLGFDDDAQARGLGPRRYCLASSRAVTAHRAGTPTSPRQSSRSR